MTNPVNARLARESRKGIHEATLHCAIGPPAANAPRRILPEHKATDREPT